ncbi:MAG: aldehyde dehydrogenase family protein, partial [Gammaproteobacteria bacterium]
ALTEHDAIRAIAFVGDSATGSAIMAQGAATLKRVHFELGGKNPVIVFDDADLDRALEAVVFMIYSLNGERCTSSSRLLVHRSLHDQLVERVAERARRIRIGHPLDPDTEIGPLIHPRHVDKVLGYFRIAEQEGVRIVAGGRAAVAGERFVEPTVFSDVDTKMTIAQEEIFGPVVSFIAYKDVDDAVRKANDTIYGLHGAVYTADAERGYEMARRMRSGSVTVNGMIVDPKMPFGGFKQSGIGREGGIEGLELYFEVKTVYFA